MSDPRKLIAAYLDDALTDAERNELVLWLKAAPGHRREFVRANIFEQQMRTTVVSQAKREAVASFAEAEEVLERPDAQGGGPGRLSWFRGLWSPRLVALPASVLVLIVVGLSLFTRHPSAFEETELGRITRTRSAQAPTSSNAFEMGQKVRPGRCSLLAGALEITLRNGVTMVFEGPGEIELLTPMRAILHSGQAVTRVPKNARGFRMETPGVNVVDLGTEFAVKTGPGLSTDVQVYEGEVITTPNSANASGSFPQRLRVGQAARFTQDARAVPQPLTYAPDRFVRRLPADQPIELKGGPSPDFNRSRFEEILVTHPSRAVVVDGDLSEWNAEGGFRSEREGAPGAGYFVEGRMMFDADFLYIAAHIGDPAPLRSVIDPATDGELGWRGGGLQVRLSTERQMGWPVDANAPVYYQFRGLTPDASHLAAATSDRLVHLTLWHHAPSAQSCLHIAYGMDLHGGEVNPPGYRGAFRRDADGRGYTLEYAIPWSLLHAASDPPRTGDTLGASWTVHWSDDSGRLWRGQHTEIRNATEPLRIYTWERAATWGRARYH